MADSNFQLNPKTAKVVLIPVLGAVLIYLAYPSGATKRASGGVPAVSGTAGPAPSNEPNPELPENAAPETRVWPEKTLAEILKHDPFKLQQQVLSRSPVATEAAAADQQRLIERQHAISQLVDRFLEKVPDIVIRSRHGVSAVIDGETVREGDVLNGTARVISIQPDGIVLELVESP